MHKHSINIPEEHTSSTPMASPGVRHSFPIKKVAAVGLVSALVAGAFGLGYAAAPKPQSHDQLKYHAAADDTETFLQQEYTAYPAIRALTPGELHELIDSFVRDPENFHAPGIPTEFIAALAKLQEEEHVGHEPDARRLSDKPSEQAIIEGYSRGLSDKYFDNELATLGWAEVRGEYNDPVHSSGDDLMSVEAKGTDCVIKALQSDSTEDWFNNLDAGSDYVYSADQYARRDESCGCEESWYYFWCDVYYMCDVHTVLGEGYDGFAKPWNDMRVAVTDQIRSKCANSDRYVFTGYSRGGGIVAIAAAALKKEGILEASKMRLVTYGAPRAVGWDFSDEIHGDFETWRFVYKDDPVPSVPYGWMGYTHYGEMVCFECTYPQERDRPYAASPFNADYHTSYDLWFPTA